MRHLGVILRLGLLFLCVPLGLGQTCQPPIVHKGSPPAEVPLCLVAEQVVKTLNAFNADAGSKALPKLSKVTFDFHASAAKGTGFSFGVLLFNVGANREADTINDVAFTYAVPQPPAAQPRTSATEHDFSGTLLATLQAAAGQVRQTQSIGDAKFANLSVSLGYGAVWDFSGGGAGTLGLVTLGGSIDRKRADVQTLTLSFGP